MMVVRKNVLEYIIALVVVKNKVRLKKCVAANLAEQPTEDVEIKLRTFIFEKLGIEHKIEIGNVHRFGKRE
jgi:hypothetical protein